MVGTNGEEPCGGLSKAFLIPRVNIEALLINAGLYKRTQKVILFFKPKSWQLFVNSLPDHIKSGSLQKNVWYFANDPPEHTSPGENSVSPQIAHYLMTRWLAYIYLQRFIR